MKGHRIERLADEMRMRLGEIISRMGDPRTRLATVTEVHLTPDLRHARVHVSFLGEEAEQQKALHALESARHYLRHELAHQLSLKFTPDLTLIHDRGFEYSTRVDELLRRARRPQ